MYLWKSWSGGDILMQIAFRVYISDFYPSEEQFQTSIPVFSLEIFVLSLWKTPQVLMNLIVVSCIAISNGMYFIYILLLVNTW